MFSTAVEIDGKQGERPVRAPEEYLRRKTLNGGAMADVTRSNNQPLTVLVEYHTDTARWPHFPLADQI